MMWLAVVPLVIWGYLLVLHGRFWRTDVRLPAAREPRRWPAVAVIVPARDEGSMIALTLPTLLAQDYPGPVRVVVVDDRSADDTGEVARTVAADTSGQTLVSLSVIQGAEPPPGWMGKLWALEQGVQALTGTQPAPPEELLLLTDADIAHGSSSLRRLVAWAESAGLDQVSLMARLRVSNGWERLIIPSFVYFFAQLYPFRRVNRRHGRTAAAAGGCVLIRRDALQAAGGIAAVRGAVIDDVALARAVKRSGGAIWLGLADDVTSLRPYPRLADLWDMVARSAYTELRNSPLLLAGTVAGLAVIYVGPLVALLAGVLTGVVPAAVAGGAATLAMVLSYVPMIRYYRLPWWWALGLPVAACLYGAMTVSSAWRHRRGGVRWKGRRYPGAEAGPAGHQAPRPAGHPD